MLRFEAEASALLIGQSAFAFDRSIEKIAAIELHTRLRGQHFQHAAVTGSFTRATTSRRPVWMIEDKIVVVTVPAFQLLVRLPDARANGGGLAEIKGRSSNWPQLACRNEACCPPERNGPRQ